MSGSESNEGAVSIFDLVKEWLLIYTWTELWVIVGAAVSMFGAWYLFSIILTLQNVLLRAAAGWALISGLTAGAATTNYILSRRKNDPA